MAYGQYRDQVGDWENERNFANTDYWNKYNADYNDYQTMLNYWNQMAQQENSAYYTDRDYAYSQAMAILNKGQMPSDALLAAAGLSKSDANKLKAKTSSGGGGGSSKKSSSGGGDDKDDKDDNKSTGPVKAAGNIGYSNISAAASPSWSHFYTKK